MQIFIGVRVGAHVNLRFVLSGQPCAAMGRPRYQYPNLSASTVGGLEFQKLSERVAVRCDGPTPLSVPCTLPPSQSFRVVKL